MEDFRDVVRFCETFLVLARLETSQIFAAKSAPLLASVVVAAIPERLADTAILATYPSA